jgi:Nif-specific regulatory protein
MSAETMAVLPTDEGFLPGRHLDQTSEDKPQDHPSEGKLQAALDALERDMILQALKEARGNKARAARALGITERVMGLRVRKHGIDPRLYRTGG